jgi:hypothetical protein
VATKRPSFEKRERARAKKAKADAKRERRHDRPAGEEGDEMDDEVVAPVAVDEATVLASLDELHRRYDAEEIDFDDFAEQRDALLAQLAGG